MKLNLGKTPEEQAAEEAKKERERELEIQRSNLERQRKIEALRNKQKVNKAIIIGTASTLTLALLACNVYHIFLKKDLTITDVKNQIYSQVNAYPADGLDNYIRDISQTLFDTHIGFDVSKYVSAVVDKNSVYISRVNKINNVFSQVYFMADITMTERDFKVTDPNVIAALKKGGLIAPVVSETVSRNAYASAPTTDSATTSDTTSPSDGASDITVSSTESGPSVNISIDANTSDTTSSTTSDTTSNTTSDNTSNTTDNGGNLSLSDNDTLGSVEVEDTANGISGEFYLTASGTYMQKGAKTTSRYTFMVPVEYYYNYNADKTAAVSSGYKVVGRLELYSLNEVDIFEEATVRHNYYVFDDSTAVDEQTLASARQTVNKIFADSYAGTVLPQDFVNARTFNTYGATYVRLDAFEFYTSKNPLGYNAYATYTIQLPQGFLYTTSVYLTVEPNNTTWKITAMS